MSRVRIYAFLHRDPGSGLRVAEWEGDVDWPGAPTPGATWFHCGDWGGVDVDRASFYAPTAPGEAGFVVEVRDTAEVLEHLVADHGFTGTYA